MANLVPVGILYTCLVVFNFLLTLLPQLINGLLQVGVKLRLEVSLLKVPSSLYQSMLVPESS